MRRRFLYFIPNVGAVNRQVLTTAGLFDRFAPCGKSETCALSFSHLIDGPKGSGCLVGIGSRPCEFVPERQTWHDGGAFSFALEDGALPPGPDDLIREIYLDGEAVPLADGANWIVPRLRLWNAKACESESALPKVMRAELLDGRTSVFFKSRAEHEPLERLAAELWECFVGPNECSVSRAFDACVALLGANYRLGFHELSLLGLLGEANLVHLLEIAIDIPGVREYARELSVAGVCTAVPSED